MRGRKLGNGTQLMCIVKGIKKESPNEGTETLSCMKVTDSDGISDKKESPNEGTETSSAVPLLLLLVIKKESPNKGTETNHGSPPFTTFLTS